MLPGMSKTVQRTLRLETILMQEQEFGGGCGPNSTQQVATDVVGREAFAGPWQTTCNRIADRCN
jgi:hypothetical protein